MVCFVVEKFETQNREQGQTEKWNYSGVTIVCCVLSSISLIKFLSNSNSVRKSNYTNVLITLSKTNIYLK